MAVSNLKDYTYYDVELVIWLFKILRGLICMILLPNAGSSVPWFAKFISIPKRRFRK